MRVLGSVGKEPFIPVLQSCGGYDVKGTEALEWGRNAASPA